MKESTLTCYPFPATAVVIDPPGGMAINTASTAGMGDEDTKDFVKKSKFEGSVVESTMGAKNVQMGFPNLPVYIAPASPFEMISGGGGADVGNDVLIGQTGNKGLILELARRNKSRSIAQLGLEEGVAYEIDQLGQSLSMEDSKTEPGKAIEIRKIKYLEDDGKTLIPGPSDCLTRIIHLPIVDDKKWKRFCVLLSANYTRLKEKIARQLVVPASSIDKDVLLILNEPRNKEIRELFRQLSMQINDLSNTAYSQALISGILSFVAHKQFSPIHPLVYGTGRLQESAMQPQFTDPQYLPMWKEVIFTQYSKSFYDEVLAMSSPLDVDQLMKFLFQLVFGLDFDQRNFSASFGGLDVKKLRMVEIHPDIILQFKWGDDYYRFRPGMKPKIEVDEQTRITVSGLEIGGPSPFTGTSSGSGSSSCNTDSKHPATMGDRERGAHTHKVCNFNRDLMRLGATLLKVIKEKQMRMSASSPEVQSSFERMIKQWVDCGNVCSMKKYPTSSELAQQDYRLSCLQAPDATWNTFHDIPSHTESLDAVPYNQKQFFDCFKVDKSEINFSPDAVVYVL